jgi:subtilisin-like proprotein convertase family protein
LTITADAKTKTYGSALPTLTATYSGFINGDTAARLTTLPSLTTTATAGSPAGTYTITASGAASPNYSITFVNGSLIVTPAALTIAADAKAKTYGAANPTLTATYSGFVNGDTAASLATPVILTTTATAASHVGSYPITAIGAASPNYTIAYVSSSLSVTPAVLTITANNQSRTANTANPALTASYAGFVNGETTASLTAPASLTTTATTASPAGTYPITASGAQDADYTINLVNGALTVTAAAAPSLVSLAVSTSTPSVMVGQTAQFNATGNYSDGTASNVTATASWMSSATGIASVSANGLATGLASGNAIITATMSGVSSRGTLTVITNTPSGSVTLTSTVARTIPSIGLATPYVTTINASGLPGVLSKVTVTLNGVSHTWPHDINAMLVGPAGQKVMLMRHAGGGYKVGNIAITLDDDASANMPNYSGLKTGVYKPTNYGTIYNFASPAPSAPYDTKLSIFSRTNPNGTWSLYVLDDSSADAGSMAGWSLTLTTTTVTLLDIPMAGPEPETQPDMLAIKPNITTPPAVWIESIGLNTNSQASLVLSGRPDANYTVQSTTNFVDWSEVESGIVPVGQFTVTDPQSGANAGKFYRVVAP